jgi:GNAT superfamily N-acetyltransferase
MNYVCKIATLDEIIKRMDYLIKTHPNNNLWIKAKENAIRGYKEKSKIMYIGKLDNEIICEATAIVAEDGFKGDITHTEQLLSDKRVYLCAFRTNKEYEGQGYFKTLLNYMLEDLKTKGYKEASLGVEPREVRNIQMYFHFGFTNYIKTTKETLPSPHPSLPPIEEIINFYYKEL